MLSLILSSFFSLLGFLAPILPILIPLGLALYSMYMVQAGLYSLFGGISKVAMVHSAYAYFGYMMVLSALVVFAIVLPVLSEMKGQHQRVRQGTLWALAFLVIGIFAMDFGYKEYAKKETQTADAKAIEEGKATAKEVIQERGYNAKDPKDLTMWGIVMKKEIKNPKILEEMVAQATYKSLSEIRDGYNLLGTAVDQNNIWATKILLASKKIKIWQPINLPPSESRLRFSWGGAKYAPDLARENDNGEIFKILYKKALKYGKPSFKNEVHYGILNKK